MCRVRNFFCRIAIVTGCLYIKLHSRSTLCQFPFRNSQNRARGVSLGRAPWSLHFLIGPCVATVEAHGGASATFLPLPPPEGAQVRGRTCPGLSLRSCSLLVTNARRVLSTSVSSICRQVEGRLPSREAVCSVLGKQTSSTGPLPSTSSQPGLATDQSSPTGEWQWGAQRSVGS